MKLWLLIAIKVSPFAMNPFCIIVSFFTESTTTGNLTSTKGISFLFSFTNSFNKPEGILMLSFSAPLCSCKVFASFSIISEVMELKFSTGLLSIATILSPSRMPILFARLSAATPYLRFFAGKYSSPQ